MLLMRGGGLGVVMPMGKYDGLQTKDEENTEVKVHTQHTEP